jgi:hypothetical protein
VSAWNGGISDEVMVSWRRRRWLALFVRLPRRRASRRERIAAFAASGVGQRIDEALDAVADRLTTVGVTGTTFVSPGDLRYEIHWVCRLARARWMTHPPATGPRTDGIVHRPDCVPVTAEKS